MAGRPSRFTEQQRKQIQQRLAAVRRVMRADVISRLTGASKGQVYYMTGITDSAIDKLDVLHGQLVAIGAIREVRT